MNEIHKVIDSNERILWEGRPAFLPFVFNTTGLATFIFGFIWTVIIFGSFGSIVRGTNALENFDLASNWYLIFIPHIWIGPIMMFGGPIYRILVHQFTHYAITDKRVLLQHGLIGRDFHMVDYDQITNVSVNVDLFDKLFMQDTGSILISTAGTFTQTSKGTYARPYELDSIKNPYEIFKNLKQSTMHVKTDINYPNALRPGSNPGYNTQLGVDPFAQPGQPVQTPQ